MYRAFLRWFTATNNDRWALPVLWTICNDLRELAIEVSRAFLLRFKRAEERADSQADKALVSTGAKPIKLEEAASRHLLKAFSACASDRFVVMLNSRVILAKDMCDEQGRRIGYFSKMGDLLDSFSTIQDLFQGASFWSFSCLSAEDRVEHSSKH